MRKVVILKHDGGELGNQLWNYVSIFAYALERNIQCENWTFFEYAHYFKNLNPKNILIRFLFFVPLTGYSGRKYELPVRMVRYLYKIFIFLYARLVKVVLSSDDKNACYYLPPAVEATTHLEKLETSGGNIYFAHVSGGVFRNPIGLEKFRKEIVDSFSPTTSIEKSVKKIIDPLRLKYKKIIGVHIRQSQYRKFKGGKYFVDQSRFREIIDEYLKEFQLKREETFFIITSEEKINDNFFSGLSFRVSSGGAVEDLFLLASCDIIIGSDSTFGHFSAYYGNIPHIVAKNEGMDWTHYKDKTKFFPNKYLTVMFY